MVNRIYELFGSRRQIVEIRRGWIRWANLSSACCETHWQRKKNWEAWASTAKRIK